MTTHKRRRFVYDYKAPIEHIWAAMADTARYNEAAELPRHEVTEERLDHGNMRFLAHAKMGPFELKWEDRPCNWVRNQWFEHVRYFSNGPIGHLSAHLRLTSTEEGCHGAYTIETSARNGVGRLLIATGFFKSVDKTFNRLSTSAERFAQGGQSIIFPVRPPKFDGPAKARIERLRGQLLELPQTHGLTERLIDLVATAPDNDLLHIRPLALAKLWDVPAMDAIELCLEATRAGLLELRWDILCPRCRAAKEVVRGLDQLPEGAHCGTCNIDYARDFARNVELSFRPSSLIRPISAGEFCLMGPMSTPHILLHVTLSPGEQRVLPFEADAGCYRLRTLEAGPETDIDVTGDAFPALIIEPDQIMAGEITSPGNVMLENRTLWERTAVIEDRAWTADALTADRVTAMQSFRDLFSDQVLRPGDEVSVGRIALLFSDLEGSTALYSEVGDAQAYRLVREHFAFMQTIIRRHEGAIVKTIGDAVMAAFVQPAEALQAAIDMQEASVALASDTRRIRLKIGVHVGPCIAVTLNDRLDYFGTAVNMAARLQALSLGDDVVISSELASGPMSSKLLENFTPQHETAHLKGFDQPVPFLRLVFGRE